MSRINWVIRQTVFRALVMKGVSHHIAYDAAMCAMYRDAEQPLPWGIPSAEHIRERLVPKDIDEEE